MDKAEIENKIVENMAAIFKNKPHFTGQINLEMHLKDGTLRVVYVTERSKVSSCGHLKN